MAPYKIGGGKREREGERSESALLVGR